MGGAHSITRAYYWKLAFALPDTGHKFDDEKGDGKRLKAFSSDKDREQFIHAVIIVITQNGLIDLKEHNFRLLYARRENDHCVARIVAEKDGVIRAVIEPMLDGQEQGEAFRALRKDVEIKLDKILANLRNDSSASELPSLLGSAVGSSSPRVMGTQHVFPSDAPPEYGSGDVSPRGRKS